MNAFIVSTALDLNDYNIVAVFDSYEKAQDYLIVNGFVCEPWGWGNVFSRHGGGDNKAIIEKWEVL